MQISFVRRLDELGRIVIPKEIRNKLNFSAGDLLDLNIENDNLIIKKSNNYFNKDYVEEIINLVEYLSNFDIILTNNEKVIAKSSNLVNLLLESNISEILKKVIFERKSNSFLNGLNINENFYLDGKVFVKTLIKDSNTLGLLIIRANDNIRDIHLFLDMVSKLLLQ